MFIPDKSFLRTSDMIARQIRSMPKESILTILQDYITLHSQAIGGLSASHDYAILIMRDYSVKAAIRLKRYIQDHPARAMRLPGDLYHAWKSATHQGDITTQRHALTTFSKLVEMTSEYLVLSGKTITSEAADQ